MSMLLDAPVTEPAVQRDYISHSAISTYQRCPLRYFFRYIEGLPEKTVSSALVFGSAIHAAAEFHFNELMAGNPPPDVDTLLATYQDAWRERDLDAVTFGKKEDVSTLGQLAERVLVAFQASDIAQPAGSILGVEEELRGQLLPDCPDLLARIDLLVEDGDELIVTDLKTARSRWSSGQAEDNAEQLLLYSELAKHLTPDKSVRLQFAVLTKTKNPVVECHEVVLDDGRIARTKQVVERVWRAIESGHFYPAPSPMSCSTCPFRQPCRDWHG